MLSLLKALQLVAAILSGGKAQRLNGQIKSLINIGDKPIIAWQLSVLRKFFNEIILIGHHSFQGIKSYPDIIHDVGPIGGLYTALKILKKTDLVIFPADNPFISEHLIKMILELSKKNFYDAIIPLNGGYAEPLYGLYRHRVLPIVESLLESKNYAMQELLRRLNVYYFLYDFDPEKTFFNINYPEDIQKANKYAGEISNV